MRDIRREQAGVGQRVWEKAGWARAPRNGYEWRLLQAGKAQPKEQRKRWKKKYRCRKCKGTTFTIHRIQERDTRKCAKCEAEYRRQYYLTHKDESNKISRRHRLVQRALKPVFVDGAYTGSMTWARDHMPHMSQYVKHGIIVVEAYGEPVFAIVSLEAARRML